MSHCASVFGLFTPAVHNNLSVLSVQYSIYDQNQLCRCIDENYFSCIIPQLSYFCPSFCLKILLFSYFLKNSSPTFLLLFCLGALESLCHFQQHN